MKTITMIGLLILAVPTLAQESKQTFELRTASEKVKITTDCYHSNIKHSKVSLRPLDKKLRVKSRVRVSIDGEKMTCRVVALTRINSLSSRGH